MANCQDRALRKIGSTFKISAAAARTDTLLIPVIFVISKKVSDTPNALNELIGIEEMCFQLSSEGCFTDFGISRIIC